MFNPQNADAVTEFRNGSITKNCNDIEGKGSHDYNDSNRRI